MRRIAFLLAALPLFAGDELTVYDLLAPETHRFAIIYDVSATREGAPYYLNPIRHGSVADQERVVDRASGQPLKFDVVDGKTAKAEGSAGPNTADDDQFLRVHLLKPVAKGAETRIRIYKTYTDAASYSEKDGTLVWARPLGIKRNVVILPRGYELTASASPAIVSTGADGRLRLSFLNDRDDQLPVRITARRLPMKLLLLMLAFQFHRAEQDKEIRYWLLAPETHQFRISHDFNVDKVGQKSVHSFVRKGSDVAPDSKMFNLDTGEPLFTHIVKGKEVNALNYYPTPTDPDSIVVQGDLPHALEEGQSVRIRVEETYNDPVGYSMKGNELVWTRTLGRPLNFVTLPAGWMLTSVNTPAVISLDREGRIMLRFTNIRNDELAVTIRARKR